MFSMSWQKKVLMFWPVFLLAGSLMAQTKPAPAATNNTGAAIQQWINDNVDTNALSWIGQIDLDQVQNFFDKVERNFDSTNIYDLSDLRAIALQVLPVLNEFEETQPYAGWLRARIDDMDAAIEMQREMKAMSTNVPPGGIVPRPTEVIARSVWVREVSSRPWPPLARTYVPKLKKIFVSENVPPALVWVAGVESSFEPKARSPAGAAGMFQLMPDTARLQHLSLWPFDERYQPEKSARAAARFLHDLHRHYGNWELALAAYNVGEGRVDKLLKKHEVHSFDAVARWLPAETQMYVPKVEATILERESLALDDLKPPRG